MARRSSTSSNTDDDTTQDDTKGDPHADGAALTTPQPEALSLEDLFREDDLDEEEAEELESSELTSLATDLEAGADAAQEAGYSGLTKAEREELDALSERIARRAADQELIAELRGNGFQGREYDLFADDLARYALSVLGGWLRTGHIFALARRTAPYERELLEFSDSKDARTELAVMTIATAMPAFRQRALVEGGWDPDKGANLTTYFMGAVVFAFPNQLRARRRMEDRWDWQNRRHTGELVNLDRGAVTDTADLAVGNAHVTDHLGRLDPRTRHLVGAALDGYTQEEMTEMFGEDSVRAIEGVLYRWRTREQRRVHDTGDNTSASPEGEPR
jgi:hypothetical protein